MDLRVAATGDVVTVPAGTTAVIGADPSATIRVARPGISRRHAVVKYDGSHWVLQDASSRNGTFYNGARIQFLDIKGPTTVRLGHPIEGTEVQLTPTATAAAKATAPTGQKPATIDTPSAATRSDSAATRRRHSPRLPRSGLVSLRRCRPRRGTLTLVSTISCLHSTTP